MSACAVEGCDRPVLARGWCGAHYARWRHYGDPTQVPALICRCCGAQFAVALAQQGRGSGSRRYCDECRGSTDREYRAMLRGVYVDTIRSYQKHWYAANQAHALAYSRAYANQHREQRQAWMDVNRVAVQQWTLRRRARLAAVATVPFAAEHLAQQWAFYGNKCWLCRADATASDHVKPISRGGPHMLANLRPICKPCNSAKGNRWPYPTGTQHLWLAAA